MWSVPNYSPNYSPIIQPLFWRVPVALGPSGVQGARADPAIQSIFLISHCQSRWHHCVPDLLPHRPLEQLTLQGASMHAKAARSSRNVAGVIGEHTLNVFPRQPVYREWFDG